MTCPAAFNQVTFRGRNDDGNETTATWIGASENQDWDQEVNVNFRVRFEIQETAACAGNNKTWQLQYNKLSAGWVNVNATSVVVRSSASPNLADAANLTDQLSSGTGTFQGATGFDEVNGAAGGSSMDVAISGHAEAEFCVQLRSADVVNGDTIQLRATDNSTAFAAYDAVPLITVASSTIFTRSLSDIAAISDAFSRTSIANRSYSQNLGITDAIARLSNANRSYSDNLGQSDSFARIADGIRIYSDSLAISDILATQLSANRSYIDNLAASDSFARIADASRIYSNSLGVSEVFVRVANTSRAYIDTAAIADVLTRQADASRSYIDTAGLANIYARVADALRSFNDLLGITDTVSTLKVSPSVQTLSVSDLLGISETFTRQANANRALTDAMGILDSMQRIASAMRGFSDFFGISETSAIASSVVPVVPVIPAPTPALVPAPVIATIASHGILEFGPPWIRTRDIAFAKEMRELIEEGEKQHWRERRKRIEAIAVAMLMLR